MSRDAWTGPESDDLAAGTPGQSLTIDQRSSDGFTVEAVEAVVEETPAERSARLYVSRQELLVEEVRSLRAREAAAAKLFHELDGRRTMAAMEAQTAGQMRQAAERALADHMVEAIKA